MTLGHGRLQRSRPAPVSHLLGPSLTWQESEAHTRQRAGRGRPGGERGTRPSRGSSRRRLRAPPSGTWASPGPGFADRRVACVPGPTAPRASLGRHPASLAAIAPRGRPGGPHRWPARPPFLPPGRRDPAPPPLTYLVTEFEERHGGGLRRRPGPPLPPSSLGRCPGPTGRRPAALRSPRIGGGAASRATSRGNREVRSPAGPASSSEDSPPSSFLSLSLSCLHT